MLVTRICPNRLSHERAADLLLEIEALARRHGFLLERNLRVNEANEMPSVRIRLIETAADAGAIEPGDREMIRGQIVQSLKAVALFGPPPLLEPYDWGPGGVPQGQPIHYEPGYGWKVGEDD